MQKITISIILLFISTILIMKSLFLLNKANTLYNIIGIISIMSICYIIIKTRIFTKFNKKQK